MAMAMEAPSPHLLLQQALSRRLLSPSPGPQHCSPPPPPPPPSIDPPHRSDEEDAPSLHAAPPPPPHRRSRYLLGRSKQQLEKIALGAQQKRYRGRHLHELLYKAKGKEIHKFLQLPQSFRDHLEAENWKVGRSEIHELFASTDGTLKALLKLEDSKIIEAVGIPVEEARGINRLTVCVSTQVGCPLSCEFCATGKGGYSRNLRAHEIIDQVLTIEQLFKHKVTSVVFMGMGEPLLNFQGVLAAHNSLDKDIGIPQRMMTISTVGIPNTIVQLAQHRLKSTLSVSLHAANQALREKIVPTAKSYPIAALMEDCKEYFSITNKKPSFEYTLLAGINDGEHHAMELADLLCNWNLRGNVNLTLYNPISDSEFKRPFKASVVAFKKTLNDRGLVCNIRPSHGLDADAGFGQLKNSFQKLPHPGPREAHTDSFM